jgi:hypothetical protein
MEGSMQGKMLLLAAVGLALVLNGAALPGELCASPRQPGQHTTVKKIKAKK